MGNLIIAINDLKEELTICVNNAVSKGVPFTVIEPIMMNMMSQVRSYAKAELDGAKNLIKQEESRDESVIAGSEHQNHGMEPV
jgi:hypothetical protein